MDNMIDFLVKEGFSIVYIGELDKYYLCRVFTPAKASGSESIDFHEMRKTIEISDFIKTQRMNVNEMALTKEFYQYIENKKERHIKISCQYRWIWYIN